MLEFSEGVLFLFGRTGLVHDFQVHSGFRICEVHEELCLLDHCRIVLMWESLLPEVLISSAGKKRSIPGKKSLKSKS